MLSRNLTKLGYLGRTNTQNTNIPFYDEGTPSLDLNFAGNKNLVDNVSSNNLVTFTRASGGTYVGSDGLIKTAVTNLFLQSEAFETASWGKTNCTVTANASVNPYGATTADKLSATVNNSFSLITQTVNVTAGFYTASIFAKAGEFSWLLLKQDAGTAPGSVYRGVWFNLANGTIGTNEGLTASIQALSNGWYRCSITYELTGAGTTNIAPHVASANGTNSVSGADGVKGIFVWGTQLEQSFSVGEYVPTTTTLNSAPRFTHNSATGASLGLLVEEQRTNLHLYSEDISQWLAPYQVTATLNATTAPDNLTTADRLLETTANDLHAIEGTAFSFVTNTVYTYSVFVKPIGDRNFEIAFPDIVFTNRFARFTLTGTGLVQGTDSGVTAEIQAFSNGWYRCIATSTCASGAGARIGNFLNNATNSRTYAGDVAKGIFIWGAQLETGYGASSYIPTTTAQVTRAKDIATISGTNFTSWYQQAEGTIFVEYIGGRNYLYNAYGRIATTNVWSVEKGANGFATNFITGASQLSSISLVNSFVSTSKVVAAWQGSAISTVISDGNLPSFSSGSLAISGTATKLNIGTDNNGNVALDGTIARIAYFPTRLSNTTLQNITK